MSDPEAEIAIDLSGVEVGLKIIRPKKGDILVLSIPHEFIEQHSTDPHEFLREVNEMFMTWHKDGIIPNDTGLIYAIDGIDLTALSEEELKAVGLQRIPHGSQ